MAVTVAELVARLKADTAQFTAGMSRAKRDLNEVDRAGNTVATGHRRMATAAKVAGVGIAGGMAIGALAVKKMVAQQREAQRVGRITDAVLKSTGGAAKVSADQVGALADSISVKTGIDDEAIQSGENLLLTFTRVRNEVGKGNDIFNQGTQIATDMSVALGQDMKSSVIQVGKALNDPVKGMTALRRVGVSFTQQQIDQVKALEASGKHLQAQKIVLGELKTEFGGTAAAAADPMQRLGVVINNVFESLGTIALPIVNAVANGLAAIAPKVGPAVEKVKVGLDAMKSAFSGEGVTSDGFVGVMERIGVAARVVVDWIRTNWPQIKATIQPVLETVIALVTGFADIVTTLWNNFGNNILSLIMRVWPQVRKIISGVMLAIRGIVQIITALIHGDWSKAWEGVKMLVAGVWRAIIGIIGGALEVLRFIVGVALEVVGSIFKGAWRAIQSGVSGFVGAVVGFFVALPGRVLGALGDLGRTVWGGIAAGFDWLRTQFSNLIGDIVGFFSGLPGRVISAIGDLAGKIFEAIKSAASSAIDRLPGPLKGIAHKIFGGQRGGIVDFARSGELAVLHGREAILPLNDARQSWRILMASGLLNQAPTSAPPALHGGGSIAGGGTAGAIAGPMYVTIVVDRVLTHDELVTMMEDLRRRRGYVPATTRRAFITGV